MIEFFLFLMECFETQQGTGGGTGTGNGG